MLLSTIIRRRPVLAHRVIRGIATFCPLLDKSGHWTGIASINDPRQHARQRRAITSYLSNQSECVMLDTKDLLEHAERCRTLADLSRLPQVSQRLRVLAQRYTEQARDIKRQRAAAALLDNEKTTPAPETLDVSGQLIARLTIGACRSG
jgi:hypothetical protein